MNIWIIAPGAEHEKLVSPLRLKPYRVFCNETVTAAFEALPAGVERVDAFVLAGLEPTAVSHGIAAIRTHPKLATTPVLVVSETLGEKDAAALRKAGADLCYRLPFAAPVFAARVRAAAAVKR